MEIIDEVRQVVAKALKVPFEQVKPDSRLADIGLNSLDVIEIIFELEEKFGIDIPLNPEGGASDPAAGRSLPFDTLTDVAAAIKTHVDAKRTS